MNYTFNVENAKKYGVDEAIIIENFKFWILKNKANKKNFYDNKYWTYNSKTAFVELFPFYTESQIKRILNSLIDKKVIITGNYNKEKYDRTLWYSFHENFLYLAENQHYSESSNGVDENNQPIPNNKPDNKNILSKDNIQKENLNKKFEEFWGIFPKQRRGSKDSAFKAYCNAVLKKGISVEYLLSKVKEYANSEEVKRGYASGGARWFNDEKYNNDFSVITNKPGHFHDQFTNEEGVMY